MASAEGDKQLEGELAPVELDETAMMGDDEATATRSVEPQRLAGDTFGRYRILKTLGEGAMGSVYLALDSQLNRKVALKIPKIDVKEDSHFLERFLREARAAATLSHPNICPVYDVGKIDDTHFITMAYIQGHSLSEFINSDKPQRERNVAYLVRRIALALHEAHSNGLVHRDVKPANVMIDQRDEPIIMDFGLARHIDDSEDARLTRDGAILGSPAYMSPEQVEGQASRIGPASDVYSLGVILYELLTGKLPFRGSVASIIGQIVSREPEHPCKLRADLSSRLAEICMKAMSKRIEERYSSMKELAVALAEFLKAKSEEKAKPEESAAALPPAEPAPKKKLTKTATDTDKGLKLTSQRIEVVCWCGQRLVAKLELAGKRVKCPRCAEVVTLPDPATGSSPSRQIGVLCQQCGQRFMAQENLAGKAVRCPICGRALTVPEPGAAQPTVRKIEVVCLCGQQFLARPHLAGKRLKCTACGRPLDIPVH